MTYMNKYTVRKLVFILVLVILIASPFGYIEYRSLTTTDPFILIARELEGFEKGGIDILNVIEDKDVDRGLVIVAYIEDYPNWSVRQDQQNFNRAVLQAIGVHEFNAVTVFIGWDFPPEIYKIQGVWVCPELRRGACEWEMVPGITLRREFIVWPGIGKP